jgi:hypothetical protein
MTTFYCLKFERPQSGGPGSRIYIPQEEGGLVIPPGTGFPFSRLLRLARLWWMYSNSSPHRSSHEILVILSRGGPHRTHSFPYCYMLIHCCRDIGCVRSSVTISAEALILFRKNLTRIQSPSAYEKFFPKAKSILSRLA